MQNMRMLLQYGYFASDSQNYKNRNEKIKQYLQR